MCTPWWCDPNCCGCCPGGESVSPSCCGSGCMPAGPLGPCVPCVPPIGPTCTAYGPSTVCTDCKPCGRCYNCENPCGYPKVPGPCCPKGPSC